MIFSRSQCTFFSNSTLEERAQRLFTTKGKSLEEIDPSLFSKTKPGRGTGKGRKDTDKNREIASIEAQIYRYFISLHIFLNVGV